jgi:large subunit ribosomal protein L25
MSNEAKLVVEPRTEMGSAACRRLRKRGLVPGNVYGHNADPVAVVVSADVLGPVLKSGSRVVDLEVAGKQDKAVIREVAWDVFGRYVEHFDLLRVDPNERVTITVPIVLKGTAPGAVGGGMVEQPLHSLVIDCLAYQIPDSIIVRIGTLEMGQIVHVRDLALPDGSHAHSAADAIVVHIVKAREAAEVAATPGASEPEVVGKKVADADAAKDDKKDDKKKK